MNSQQNNKCRGEQNKTLLILLSCCKIKYVTTDTGCCPNQLPGSLLFIPNNSFCNFVTLLVFLFLLLFTTGHSKLYSWTVNLSNFGVWPCFLQLISCKSSFFHPHCNTRSECLCVIWSHQCHPLFLERYSFFFFYTFGCYEHSHLASLGQCMLNGWTHTHACTHSSHVCNARTQRLPQQCVWVGAEDLVVLSQARQSERSYVRNVHN